MTIVRNVNNGYTSRDSRNKFIADTFSKYLNSSVINIVGGGQKHLLKYINPISYLEIDVAGTPDLIVDLDKTFPLPLDDNIAECVVCTDVLEHLDEFHRVFNELLRISNKYVIISLPNALTEIRPYLKRSNYKPSIGVDPSIFGKYTKYYGLPLNKPEDRHKWFFSYSEIKSFFQFHQANLNYEIIEEVPIGASSSTLLGKFSRLGIKFLFGQDLHEDLFYRTYWCVLEKKKV